MTRIQTSVVAVIALLAGCGYSPTSPTIVTLSISQSSLPVGGRAIVTATLLGANRGALVSFNSGMGTFAPPETYAVDGVASSTFTATRAGVGAIRAVAGSVATEQLQVSIGEFPALPEVNTTPPMPTVFLSCNSGTAGVPTICSVSGSHLLTVTINWNDGASEQSVSPSTTSVAHVFPRAGSYTVIVRGEDRVGQVVHASATATIDAPPAPPPVVTPQPAATSVFMSQEADAGSAGCATFGVSATPANGRTITSLVVTHSSGGAPGPWNISGASGRFATCGLNDHTDILTATATDSSGGTATYQLIVK